MDLVATGISKRFGSTRALEGVPLRLAAGRVHALVGENGAGKSTLMKILAGVVPADAGTMTLGGEPYAPRGLREAEASGVALVFQEVTVNPALSVAENVFIGRLREFRGRLGLLDRRRMEGEAQAVLDRIGADVSARDELRRLDLGQWKCVEIARALSASPRVLLLDEATAFLSRREARTVLAAIGRLKASGLAVAFVSHHLEEVGEAADTLTILKDGRLVGDAAVGELSTEELHARMVGRAVSADLYPPRSGGRPGEPLVVLDRVASDGVLEEVSLTVAPGEILGVAGLKGSGPERVAELLAGDRRPTAGTMRLAGEPYRPATPGAAWRAGVAYLPGDRTGEGLILDFDVLSNVTLAARPRRGPFFDRRRAWALTAEAIRDLGIKARGPDTPCAALSGGNLQKVLLGKCLAPRPRVLVLNNPTRGVDVGARAEIYRIVRALAGAGVAVVLVSEDLPELLGLSDRLVVMRKGRVTATVSAASVPGEEAVVAHMT